MIKLTPIDKNFYKLYDKNRFNLESGETIVGKANKNIDKVHATEEENLREFRKRRDPLVHNEKADDD